MKKQILTFGMTILLGLGSVTFSSCGSAEHANEEVVETAYYCPMKCEGDKTYAEKGSCPTCGMDLVEVE